IDDLVPVAVQQLEHGAAQVHAAMVEGDGDLHAAGLTAVSDTRSRSERTQRPTRESATSRAFAPGGQVLVSDTGTGRIRTRASAVRAPARRRCRPYSRTSRGRQRP